MFKVAKYDYTVLRDRPEGAGWTGIVDAGEYFDSTNVEDALQELAEIVAQQTDILSFQGLTDTPNSYIGAAKYSVRVNSTADGIAFYNDNVFGIVTDSTGSRTLIATDISTGAEPKLVRMQSASQNNVVVNSNFAPAGAKINIVHAGAGPMTFIAGSGVTIVAPPSRTLVSRGAGAVFTLIHAGTNIWNLSGETEFIDSEQAQGTAYELIAVSSSRDFVLSDASSSTTPRMILVSGSGDVELTVPPFIEAEFEEGCQINMLHRGSGSLEVVAGDGVTLYYAPGSSSGLAAGTGAVMILINIGENVWQLLGSAVDG